MQPFISNYQIFTEASKGLNVYYDHFHKNPKTVIDIGAHYGGLSYAAITRGANKIMAIEADEENFKQLSVTMDYTKCQYSKDNIDIKLYLAAVVGRYAGDIVRLYKNSNSNTGQRSIHYSRFASIGKSGLTETNITTMKLETLLDIINKSGIEIIDYFKMDVEGAEYDALADPYERKIFDKCRFVDIEFHNIKDEIYFDANMNENNYKIFDYVSFFTDTGFKRINNQNSVPDMDNYKLLAYRDL